MSNQYTKFLAQVCDLTPCQSNRNWYLILLRDTDTQTIQLLSRWIEKIKRREDECPYVLFIILLEGTTSEIDSFDPGTDNVVVVGSEVLPRVLVNSAKHCLLTKTESHPCSTLEELNQRFGSYLPKRTMGMFGRCSDCQDLYMREGRKLRCDLQLYRYSAIETQRFTFTRWKRRLCRGSVNRLL